MLVIAVFSGTSFWIAELATRLGRLTGKRMVLFLHGGNLPVFGPEHRRWVERVLRGGHLMLAPSDYLADSFRSWGLDVHVIPNVLDVDRYEYQVRSAARPSTAVDAHVPRALRPDHGGPRARPCRGGAPRRDDDHGRQDHGLFDATVEEAERRGVAERITFPGYVVTATEARGVRRPRHLPEHQHRGQHARERPGGVGLRTGADGDLGRWHPRDDGGRARRIVLVPTTTRRWRPEPSGSR